MLRNNKRQFSGTSVFKNNIQIFFTYNKTGKHTSSWVLFSSEDDDVDFVFHLQNFIQKTNNPIHILLSMCTYLFVLEMELLVGRDDDVMVVQKEWKSKCISTISNLHIFLLPFLLSPWSSKIYQADDLFQAMMKSRNYVDTWVTL